VVRRGRDVEIEPGKECWIGRGAGGGDGGKSGQAAVERELPSSAAGNREDALRGRGLRACFHPGWRGPTPKSNVGKLRRW
jgi:hypothetical protein